MSELSTLGELARFIGHSHLSSADPVVRRRALNALALSFSPRPARRSVSDLLGAVLALSARTRRAILPRAHVELDVFAPGGKRAVRLTLPNKP
jgi:hypothetical protein